MEGLTLPVSEHYFHTDFGVRDSHDSTKNINEYVMTTGPGTGFFMNVGSGDSYRTFAHKMKSLNDPSYFKLLLGREFSFDSEISKAEAALMLADNDMMRRLMESYVGCLKIAKEENLVERKVRAVKDAIHRTQKHYSLSGSFKALRSKISHYEHQIHITQLDMRSFCCDGQYDDYCTVVAAYVRLIRKCRIYAVVGKKRHAERVFWDMGIFNFVRSACDVPLLRDVNGTQYFLFPDAFLKVRSNTEIEVYPLQNLTITYATDEDSGITEIEIPEMGLLFHLHHHRMVRDFIGILNGYIGKYC